MLVPAPTRHSARRSCAVASSSVAARDESVLGRTRCPNRCWTVLCQNKESTVGWFLCGWDEDLYSQSKVIMVGCCHCDILQEKNKNIYIHIRLTSSTQSTLLIEPARGKINHGAQHCSVCTRSDIGSQCVYRENVPRICQSRICETMISLKLSSTKL